MGSALIRKAAIIGALLMLLLPGLLWASALERVDVQGQDLSAWETLWEEYFPQQSLTDFIRALTSGESTDILALLTGGVAAQREQWLHTGLAMVLRLTVLVLLEVVLVHLVQGTDGNAPGKAGQMIVMAASVLFVGSICYSALESTLDTIMRLGGFIDAAVPILIPLLLASGWTATSGLLQPATLGFSALLNQWIKPVLLQALNIAMVLRMADGFSSSRPLAGIFSLIKSGVLWFLGLCLTGFVSVVGIQASAMLSYDSLALRSARYAMDAAIPDVGGLFANMLDTAVVSAQLIRHSLGIVSLLVVVMICMEPVLHLALIALSMDIASALGGILGKTPLSELFHDQASVVKLMLYSLLMVALLVLVIVSLACMAGVGI